MSCKDHPATLKDNPETLGNWGTVMFHQFQLSDKQDFENSPNPNYQWFKILHTSKIQAQATSICGVKISHKYKQVTCDSLESLAGSSSTAFPNN